jgi:hypothetical protein
MKKTASGFMLVGGVVVALIGAEISGSANNASSTPDTDWYYSVINGCGILTIMAGLVMFFFGAMWFAKK